MIILRMLDCQVSDRLQLCVLLIDLGLQALQLPANFDHALSDVGAGRCALRNPRRNEVRPAERGGGGDNVGAGFDSARDGGMFCAF